MAGRRSRSKSLYNDDMSTCWLHLRYGCDMQDSHLESAWIGMEHRTRNLDIPSDRILRAFDADRVRLGDSRDTVVRTSGGVSLR